MRYRCDNCGVLSTNPQVKSEWITDNYYENYYICEDCDAYIEDDGDDYADTSSIIYSLEGLIRRLKDDKRAGLTEEEVYREFDNIVEELKFY